MARLGWQVAVACLLGAAALAMVMQIVTSAVSNAPAVLYESNYYETITGAGACVIGFGTAVSPRGSSGGTSGCTTRTRALRSEASDRAGTAWTATATIRATAPTLTANPCRGALCSELSGFPEVCSDAGVDGVQVQRGRHVHAAAGAAAGASGGVQGREGQDDLARRARPCSCPPASPRLDSFCTA
eukprot:2562548-Rhodomonas_salina.1